MHCLSVGDPTLGVYVYKDAIKTTKPIMETINKSISDSQNSLLGWSKALVGYNQTMPNYRNCWDCKLQPQFVESLKEDYSDFKTIYSEIVLSVAMCVEDYSKKYNLDLRYMEAVNFVKYGVGEHFDVHADHGFSYTCTVSTVAYLNDGYEGGELWFNHLDQTIIPEAGDIVICPSTFIYSHASLPVKSGVKYSAVTMFDYNDANHKAGGYAG
jgi:2OG-Fe(II) oxygenase superfamily